MLCPRCQAEKFEKAVDGLVRCVRCGAMVAAEEEDTRVSWVKSPLPEVAYCDT